MGKASCTCKKCGKTTPQSYAGMCQGCYKYFRSGGVVHPLPQRGVVAVDDEGNVICHICGRSYRRLGSHIKESHDMTVREYKEEFGLCFNTRTTSDEYNRMMHDYAIDNGMDKKLQEKG